MPTPPPALSKDNPYLGMGFTKITLFKQGVASNFGPQHARQVSRILDDCLKNCATYSYQLVNIGQSNYDEDYRVTLKSKVVKDLTTTVQNLTDVIEFFNSYIKEDAVFERKMVEFRYLEHDGENENILRVVVCCRFLPISDRIDFVKAINGIANKETKISIALFKNEDEENAIDCASFEEKLHKNNITDDSSGQIKQLLTELAKLTVTDAQLDVVSDVFLGKSLLDDDDTVTSDLSRPSTSSSSDSSRFPTSSGRVSPTTSGRVSPTSFDKESDDIDNKLPEQNIKIKPNATVKQRGFLPFRGGKKKTRKQKRKRATRRRARR